MRRLFLLIAFLIAAPAWGACSGSSPNYTAASASYADVAACVALVVNGDTVHIPAGTATWASNMVAPAGFGFTLIGAGTPNSGAGTSVPGANCQQTIIIVNGGSTTPIMAFSPASGATMRVSCMDIEPVTASTALYAPIQINGIWTTTCPQFRVDNLEFGKTTQWTWSGTSYNSAELVHEDNVCGVNDHNLGPPGTDDGFIAPAMSSYQGTGAFGDNSWAQADSLGGPNNIFTENNTWYTATRPFIDCEANGPSGCRYVSRHDNVIATGPGTLIQFVTNHGLETGGRLRSSRENEVYADTFTINASALANSIYGSRGGVFYFFNNHVIFNSGAFTNGWGQLQLYRNVYTANPWGACGGLNTLDPWDNNGNTIYYTGTVGSVSGGNNTETDSGSPAWPVNFWASSGSPYSVYDVTKGANYVGEIQSNTANSITVRSAVNVFESNWHATGLFTAGDTYQIIRSTNCIDQIGRGQGNYISGNTPSPTGWVSEALDPSYDLGNTFSGSSSLGPTAAVNTTKVLANRDFYTQTAAQVAQTSASAPFNGTSGTGWGTLALRPTTCTTNPLGGKGVAYMETDHGNQIDFCIATNVWSTLSSSPPSYVPYTYPHPLDGGTPQALAPSCTPTSGVVPQTVTCTNPNSGTTVMGYAVAPTVPATNGLGTGMTTGTTYTTAITVSSAETLNVIAGVAGDTDSPVVSYTYTAAASVPTVTTTTASLITTTTASTGGVVTANGGASVTAEGVACGLTANPVVGSSCSVASGGTATPFTIVLGSGTPLAAATTYHIRGYATNSAGTGYGADLTFTTLAANCSSPTTVGIYTVCNATYNFANSGTTVSVNASPFAGNPVYLGIGFCGTGCTTTPPAATITISDNINNPETCFHASPHSPFAMAMPTVPDYETLAAYFAPDACLPSGITSFTITFSTAVQSPQVDEIEIKAGQIATSGYFESVDNLATSGGVAGLSATVSTSATTVNANDLILATLANCGATNPAVPGTGYTGLVVNPLSVKGHVLEAMGVSTVGVKTATTTWSGGTAPTSCQAGAGGSNTVSFGMITPLESVNGSTLLAPATNNFGSVNVGSSSAAQTFTVTNNNATTATAITPTVTGGNTGDFSIGSNTCTSLTTGNSCTFAVTFTPAANGARATTLSVSYSGGDGATPQTAALSGTGINAPAATPSCSPGGGTFAGSSGPITCSVTGGAPLICYNMTGYIAINGAGSCPAGSNHYTGGFIVSLSGTLFAWAGGTGFADSATASYGFTINPITPPAPSLKILVKNVQNQTIIAKNTTSLGTGGTITIPQQHTLTVTTTCNCTVNTSTSAVTCTSCPQTIQVVN